MKKIFKKLIFLLLFCSLGWTKNQRVELSFSTALSFFSDSMGGGIILTGDYPFLQRINISWPIKARGVVMGSMSENSSAIFQNIGIGVGICGYYIFPDLSRFTIEGGLDIVPALYGFTFTTENGKGYKSGMGVILSPYLGGKYTFIPSVGMRVDLAYQAGIYDTFFGSIILGVGVVYAF